MLKRMKVNRMNKKLREKRKPVEIRVRSCYCLNRLRQRCICTKKVVKYIYPFKHTNVLDILIETIQLFFKKSLLTVSKFILNVDLPLWNTETVLLLRRLYVHRNI